MDKNYIASLLDDTRSKLQSAYNELKPLTKEHYDLKLYDVAANAEENDFDNYFDNFCEINYECFMNDLENLDVSLKQVGRTSAFTFTTDFLEDIDIESFDYFVDSLSSQVVDTYFMYKLGSCTNDEMLTIIEDVIADYELDDQTILDEIGFVIDAIPQVKESIHKLQSAIDCLECAKRNQLANWEEFVQSMKEDEESREI